MTPTSAIILTSALTALSALPLDVMLPSFVSIANAYETSVDSIASLVGYFAITFSVAQLIVGPLSDQVGRRRVLLIGLLIAAFGAVGGALAQSYASHAMFRVVQAVGCSCFILAQAIIQDTFPGGTGLRARIFNVTFGGLCIAGSPLLGVTLQEHFGWQASFWLFAVISIGVLLHSARYLTDTPRTQHREPSDYAKLYWQLANHRAFLTYTLIGTIAFSCHFSFIILSPNLFFDILEFTSHDYAKVLLLYGGTYLLGGFLADRVAKRIAVQRQVQLGISMVGIASALMIALYFGLGDHAATAMVPMLVATLGTTLIRPAAATLAMALFENYAGTAAAASGAIRFFVAGTLSIGLSNIPLSKFLLLTLLLLASYGACATISCRWRAWRS
ncbi:MFS transporter [Pandoraea faecigallinarum]|nr:MFS transporter [Pandoraea faecigallinarum]